MKGREKYIIKKTLAISGFMPVVISLKKKSALIVCAGLSDADNRHLAKIVIPVRDNILPRKDYGKMSKIVLYERKEDCCGCGACVQICPRQAISMGENEYGFIYPAIDEKLCVQCGRCKAVCGYQNETVLHEPIRTYAVVDKDEGRLKKSASGGAFAAIAAEVLNDGGVVFGAEMATEDEKISIRHVMIERKSDISRLQSSKYVQSKVGDVYKKAADLLQSGRKVLFSGTPCQIAGLKQFLKETRNVAENLYLVDIICHGVPNQRMFDDYLDVLSEVVGARVEKFNFRPKDSGWGLEGKYYYKEGGEERSKMLNYHLCSYYVLFLNSDIYRESCYSCRYAKGERVSDITLGDYWGIEKEQPEALTQNGGLIDMDKGVSCLIVNTAKGAELYDRVKDNMISVESDFTKVQKNNGQLREPSHKGKNRETVFRLYRKGDYSRVEKWFQKEIGMKKYYYKIVSILPKGFKKAVIKVVTSHEK